MKSLTRNSNKTSESLPKYKDKHSFVLGKRYDDFITIFSVPSEDAYFQYFFAVKVLLPFRIPFQFRKNGESMDFRTSCSIEKDILEDFKKWLPFYRNVVKLKTQQGTLKDWLLELLYQYNGLNHKVLTARLKKGMIDKEQFDFYSKKGKLLRKQIYLDFPEN